VPAENQAGFRLIRQHTTTPLAVGEIFSHVWDANILIQEQLIDYLRATVLHAGGITNLKKIAAFATCTTSRPAATAPPTCRR
jgi:mannonate dehydratase